MPEKAGTEREGEVKGFTVKIGRKTISICAKAIVCQIVINATVRFTSDLFVRRYRNALTLSRVWGVSEITAKRVQKCRVIPFDVHYFYSWQTFSIVLN